MTNEQLLSEIGALFENTLEEKLEQKLEEKLEQKLEEKLEQKLEEKLEQKFELKLSPIYSRLDGIDNRLDEIDDRLDGIDDRLDGIDERLDSMDGRLKKVESTQENKIIPVLDELSTVYTSAFKTYFCKAQKIDEMELDINILKSLTSEHSKILKRIS